MDDKDTCLFPFTDLVYKMEGKRRKKETETEVAVNGPDQDFAVAIMQNVAEQSKSSQFSDVVIEVEGKQFKSHRFMLSACSGFFQGLFNSGMREDLNQEVTLSNLSKETFSLIIESIFGGKNVITSKKLIELWMASDMLAILFLKTKCESFAKANLSMENCVTIHETAKRLNVHEIVDSAFDFMLSHFDDLAAMENYYL